jgi:hypothetical protein
MLPTFPLTAVREPAPGLGWADDAVSQLLARAVSDALMDTYQSNPFLAPDRAIPTAIWQRANPLSGAEGFQDNVYRKGAGPGKRRTAAERRDSLCGDGRI